MRKLSMLALTAAAVIATTASPLSVHAGTRSSVAESLQKNGYAVIGGTVNCTNGLKDILCQLGTELDNGTWNNCIQGVVIQGTICNKPETSTPGTSTPETNKPGNSSQTPSQPEAEKPGNSSQIPSQPEAEKPGNSNQTPSQPETEKPEEDKAELTFAEQVVKLVNVERAKAGLPAVTLDKEIEAAALVRAKEIETSFSHTRPNGSKFYTILQEMGITYRGAGENIAWGQKSPEAVMEAWMNSEGHRANILNAKYTKIGVGYYQNANGRNFWTQLFTY